MITSKKDLCNPYFPHLYDTLSERSNFWEDRFILAHGLRGHSPSWEAWQLRFSAWWEFDAAACYIVLTRKQRNWGGKQSWAMISSIYSCFCPSDPLPSAGLHLLRVLNSSPAAEQVSGNRSRWGIHIHTVTISNQPSTKCCSWLLAHPFKGDLRKNC